jgi:hypothetical protein
MRAQRPTDASRLRLGKSTRQRASALRRVKLKPQIVIRFKVGVPSLVDELKQARDSGADSLIGWTVGPEEGVISAGRAEIRCNVPQFGPWPCRSDLRSRCPRVRSRAR